MNRSLVKYVICLGAFLSNLSAGMFNVSLLDISLDLSISPASAQWVVSIYLLVISALLPIMGKLGDRLGRRKVHNAGLFAFAAGALGCALAPNAMLLLGFRAVQGVGAAMYQATNMALIVAVFPKEQRGRALGLMSTFVAAGSIAGPALGGFIVQWLSWESNFWLLAGVAVVVGVLAERSIPRDTEIAGGRLDIGGVIYFAACLTTLMIALDLGGRSSFLSLPVLLLTGVSVLSGAALTVRQRYLRRLNGRGGQAKVPDHAGNSLLLLGDRRFTSGIAITVITYMAAFAAQLALPAVLRLGGMEPAWIGLTMIGYPLALVIVAPLSGAIADRKGPLGIMTYGLLLMAATLVVLGLTTPEPGTGFILLPIVLLGCSMGMITSPNTSLVMGLAPKENLGMASSLLALSRNIGMMFGTAAGGIVIGSSSGFVGSDMSYRAVFLACSVAVALVCILSAYVYRRADKAKRTTEVGWPRR